MNNHFISLTSIEFVLFQIYKFTTFQNMTQANVSDTFLQQVFQK